LKSNKYYFKKKSI